MSHPFSFRRSFSLTVLYAFCILLFTFLPQKQKPLLFLGSALVFAALVFFAHRGKALCRRIAPILLAVALSLIPSYLYDLSDDALEPHIGKVVTAELTVSDISYNENGVCFGYGTLTSVDEERAYIKVRITTTRTNTEIGDVLRAKAYVQSIAPESSEEGDLYVYSRGYRYELTLYGAKRIGESSSPTVFFSHIRASLCAVMSERVKGEAGMLLSALLLGERDGLSDAFTADMARLGTSHMLALSGLHVGVLLLGIERLLSRIRIGKKTRYALVAVLTVLYLFLTGMPVSAIRAGVMLLILFISFFLAEEYDGITSLGFTVAIICTLQPFSVLDGSLWLSAFATFGILLALEREKRDLLTPRDDTFLSRAKRYLLSSVKITLAASLATLPLTAYMFGSFPLLFIFANLLFAPLMQILITLAICVLLFGWIPFVSMLAGFAARLMIDASAWLSSIPGTQISVRQPFVLCVLLLAVILVFLYVGFCPKARFVNRAPIAILLAASLLIGSFYGVRLLVHSNDLRVEYATTEKENGDFFVLRQGASTTVIDCTGAAKTHFADIFATVNALYECEVDNYVFTSYHKTLFYSLDPLLSEYAIHRLYIPSPESETERDIADELTELAKARHVKLIFYDPQAPLALGKATFTLHHRHSLASKLQRTYFSVSYGEKSFAYLSSGMLIQENFSRIAQEIEGYRAVFFGVYGSEIIDRFKDLSSLTEASAYAIDKSIVPFLYTNRLYVADTHSLKWKQ